MVGEEYYVVGKDRSVLAKADTLDKAYEAARRYKEYKNDGDYFVVPDIYSASEIEVVNNKSFLKNNALTIDDDRNLARRFSHWS